MFEAIYKEVSLQKSGVIVSDFVPENERLINLSKRPNQNLHYMKAIDSLNKKWKIRLAHKMGNQPTKENYSLQSMKNFENIHVPEASFRFH